MAKILIGIDDTDNQHSPGTGQLARRLVPFIQRLGGKHIGTTAHQFLIDPLIPYTGHNRGICVAIEWAGPIENLDFVFDLIAKWSAGGSDPGVCVALADSVTAPVVDWGERALREVLAMDHAIALAHTAGLTLRALGGTGQGIIGALACVGLHAGGEFGRFVDMPGLRELGETVTAETLASMGIVVDHHAPDGSLLTPAQISPSPPPYKTRGWIRPRLSRGHAVLPVEWCACEAAWMPIDRKKNSSPGTIPYRRIHSLCGAAFGLFVVFHLLVIATALTPARFQQNSRALQSLSEKLPAIEIVVVLLPLLVLLLTGWRLLLKTGLRYNVDKCRRGGRTRFFLQRLTAAFLLLFLAAHVLAFSPWGLHELYNLTHAPLLHRFAAGSLFDPARPLDSIVAGIAHPWPTAGPAITLLAYAFYLFGILALTYHLANGLWTGAIQWGFLDASPSQKRWGRFCAALGVLLGMLGLIAWYAVTLGAKT